MPEVVLIKLYTTRKRGTYINRDYNIMKKTILQDSSHISQPQIFSYYTTFLKVNKALKTSVCLVKVDNILSIKKQFVVSSTLR